MTSRVGSRAKKGAEKLLGNALKMAWEIVQKMLWEVFWEVFWEIFWEIVFGPPKCRFCETSTNLRFLGNFPRSPRSAVSSKNALGNHPKTNLGNRLKAVWEIVQKVDPLEAVGVEQGQWVSGWRSGAKRRKRWRYKCNQTTNTIRPGLEIRIVTPCIYLQGVGHSRVLRMLCESREIAQTAFYTIARRVLY